jgi:alpha-galactosidase
MSPSADALLATADALEAKGLHALGFSHVNLDDGMVEVGRAADGQLVADARGFPAGMRAVADALHARNFTFGVYTDRGPLTCGGRAAAQGNEARDAAFYAANGVDYVKEDSCNAPQDHPTAFAMYDAMRKGLDATGREIFFSLCGWNEWYCAFGAGAAPAPDTAPAAPRAP